MTYVFAVRLFAPMISYMPLISPPEFEACSLLGSPRGALILFPWRPLLLPLSRQLTNARTREHHARKNLFLASSKDAQP